MDTNISAWLIAGGPSIEIHAVQRAREQLHALRASQRVDRVSLIERLRIAIRPRPVKPQLNCCTA